MSFILRFVDFCFLLHHRMELVCMILLHYLNWYYNLHTIQYSSPPLIRPPSPTAPRHMRPHSLCINRVTVYLTSRQRPPTRRGQRPRRHTKVVPSGAATCRLSGGFFEIKCSVCFYRKREERQIGMSIKQNTWFCV